MIDMRDVLYTTDRLETVQILYKILHKRLVDLEEWLVGIEMHPDMLHQVFRKLAVIITSLVQMKRPLRSGEELLMIPHTDRERGYLKAYVRGARLAVKALGDDTTELERLCGRTFGGQDGLRKPVGERPNL